MAQEEDDKVEATGELGPVPDNFPGKFITPLFFNQFHIVVSAQTTRVTLGEIVFIDAPAHFSSAYVVPTMVAIDMAENILRIAREQGYLKDQPPTQGVKVG